MARDFGPHRISCGRVLQIYFLVAHDPTERDRQGPDTGTQFLDIAINVLPKVRTLERLFPKRYHPDPALVAAAQPVK